MQRCIAIRRRNAIAPEFFSCLIGQPIGGPRGCELCQDLRLHTCCSQGGLHIVVHLRHGRTSAVGGRDDDLQTLGAVADVAQHTHLAQRHHRDFRVAHVFQQQPQRVVWMVGIR